ncbi:DNA methylase [Pseudomonas sp. S37]|uniref:DNA methylase n=1 Tax=Pseudomonas sp. S37 TaxID=2767449 RepID=UPI001911D9B2|nr:DNA methylase [Pseudomonas sp. S37]
MNTISARDLGIDVAGTSGLYLWLLASFLMGKRIRSTVAVTAYQVLIDQQGLDTPRKLGCAPHSLLVRLLGQAGYTRYDESTARRLHRLGDKLEAELDHQLGVLQNGEQNIDGFQQWLLSFEGIGPKTVEIFMREASALLSALCEER